MHLFGKGETRFSYQPFNNKESDNDKKKDWKILEYQIKFLQLRVLYSILNATLYTQTLQTC